MAGQAAPEFSLFSTEIVTSHCNCLFPPQKKWVWGDQVQALVLAKQALYHLGYIFRPSFSFLIMITINRSGKMAQRVRELTTNSDVLSSSPQDPYGRKRMWTPVNCPDSCTHTTMVIRENTHIYEHKINQMYFFH